MFTQTRKIDVPELRTVRYLILEFSELFGIPAFGVQPKVLLKSLEEIVRKVYDPYIFLGGMKYFYPTCGITEGLNNWCVSKLRVREKIGLLPGEYEWPRFYTRFTAEHPAPIRHLYISNPSAIDGNYIDESQFYSYMAAYEDVALDGAYLGIAGAPRYRIVPPTNVSTIFLGMSKTFCIPDMRIGFTFSREPLEPLNGLTRENDYFNYGSVMIAKEILTALPLDHGHSVLAEQQREVVTKHDLIPSHVPFIATSLRSEYDFFRRASMNRLCLTELMTP